MILSFSTNIDGKPTYFVERIHSGLIINDLMDGFETKLTHTNFSIDAFAEKHMKIHTLRNDVYDVWQRGVPIEFMINNEDMNAFQFAPVLPVISIQTIEIVWYSHIRILEVSILSPERYNHVEIIIDDKLLTINDIIQLAQNDGFDTIEDFFAYFNTDFKGKIIHWTNFKYL